MSQSESYGYNYTFQGSTSRFTVGKVMTEPFPDGSVKTQQKQVGDFIVVGLANTKSQLTRLRLLADVLRPDGTVMAHIGDHVWVRADLYASDWGKNVFTAPTPSGEELRFILLPVERVEVFE